MAQQDIITILLFMACCSTFHMYSRRTPIAPSKQYGPSHQQQYRWPYTERREVVVVDGNLRRWCWEICVVGWSTHASTLESVFSLLILLRLLLLLFSLPKILDTHSGWEGGGRGGGLNRFTVGGEVEGGGGWTGSSGSVSTCPLLLSPPPRVSFCCCCLLTFMLYK